MTLAEEVLPLVRTRTDLHRWRDANEYGAQLHDAVTLLQEAATNEPPAEVLTVTQKAITSACKVIMRADDSSGIIGSAIQEMLELHAQLARTVPPPYRKLVDWMIRFQFDNECDFFTIDPVAYAPALSQQGWRRTGRGWMTSPPDSTRTSARRNVGASGPPTRRRGIA